MKTPLLLTLLLASCASTGWDTKRPTSFTEPKSEWGSTIYRPIDAEDLHRKNMIILTSNPAYELWERLAKNWNHNNQ